MITDTILFILQCVSTAVMNLLIFLFLGIVYRVKFESKILYIALYFLTTVLFITVNKAVELLDVTIFNFVYGFVYTHILSSLLFKSNYKKTFMYNSLFIIALLFSDILKEKLL